jgi:anti-sigma regulatory factor (Ser/Thr protein kinase)
LKKNVITISASTSELYSVREAVKAFIGTRMEKNEAGRVVLAIDEALSNIIIHGYECDGKGKILIEMESDRSLFRFTISDNAPAFNPLDNPPPDIDEYLDSGRSHGLGVDIFKKTMEVYYEKNETGGNRLIMVKQRTKKPK